MPGQHDTPQATPIQNQAVNQENPTEISPSSDQHTASETESDQHTRPQRQRQPPIRYTDPNFQTTLPSGISPTLPERASQVLGNVQAK